MELDELLADLQSVIPEATTDGRASAGSGKGQYDYLPDLPGADDSSKGGRRSDPFEVPPGYDPPAMTPPPGDEEEEAYSTVTHTPRYVPKQEQRGESPPPAKPRRTDRPEYDTTAMFRKQENVETGGGGGGGGGGLEELDNLLEMLSTTQQKQTTGANEAPPTAPASTGRPTVSQFMDELTEVERKVSHEREAPKSSSRPTASAATHELDMLMADLSDFKLPPQAQVSKPPPPPQEEGPYARPHKEPRIKSQISNLDSMIGSLQSNMNRQGIDTSSKGTCAACDKPIFGKVINAMKRVWHPEHFTCSQCDTELGNITFYEHNNTPYCEKDYHELFAPRCAYCNGPILDRCMRALDKTWHPEHFFCTLCGKHFGPEGFHAKDSKAYCRECYFEKFAPRCKRCEKAIMEGFITALGSQWHSDCFCCKVCSVTFPHGDYYDYNGEPHCEIHYHAQRGTLCAQCQKPITGQCVSAMGKKFHPDHFTCAFCLKQLNKGTFKEHRNNAYCQPCFIKLFG